MYMLVNIRLIYKWRSRAWEYSECRRKAWLSWFVRSGHYQAIQEGTLERAGLLLSAIGYCGQWYHCCFGRNNCECLDDQLSIVHESRDASVDR
jgi:hypothetical protein